MNDRDTEKSIFGVASAPSELRKDDESACLCTARVEEIDEGKTETGTPRQLSIQVSRVIAQVSSGNALYRDKKVRTTLLLQDATEALAVNDG